MSNSPESPTAHHDSYLGPERRRHPRVTLKDDVKVTVSVVVDAEVLDISNGGALLSTGSPLAIGERGHLRVLLSREPFTAWVHVRRMQPGTIAGRESRHRLGVSFAALDDTSRRTLQRFVKDDGRA